MSAKGKLAAYVGFSLLVLALIHTLESELGTDFGISIPSEIKTPMNTIALLVLALPVVLAALHLMSDDDE